MALMYKYIHVFKEFRDVKVRKSLSLPIPTIEYDFHFPEELMNVISALNNHCAQPAVMKEF